jgi:hypothetical protein
MANYDMDKSLPTSDVIGMARTAGRDSSKTTTRCCTLAMKIVLGSARVHVRIAHGD